MLQCEADQYLADGTCPLTKGEDIITSRELDKDISSMWLNIRLVFIIFAVLRVMAGAVLVLRCRKRIPNQ